MKIRTDYVTNSSSSSFILGFKNEDEINNVANELPGYWSTEAKDGVVEDIKDGITTKEAAVNHYKDYMWTDDWKFNGKDYWDLTREERLSDEYNEFIQNKTNEYAEELLAELNSNEIISIVEYEDHTDLGSELEHHIMPFLNSTLRRISHH